MRLRRGVVRKSCDFCHRRKVICDRLARLQRGHASCSQCSIRYIQCRMDDSDDVRLHSHLQQPPRRRAEHDRDRRARHTSSGHELSQVSDVAHSGAHPITTDAASNTPFGSDPLAPPPRSVATSPSSLPLLDSLSPLLSQQPHPPTPQPSTGSILPSLFAVPEHLGFLDNPFQLNPSSIFFLDKIFMGDMETQPGWSAQPAPQPQSHVAVSSENSSQSATPVRATVLESVTDSEIPVQERLQQPQAQSRFTGPQDGGFDPPPWVRCRVDQAIFLAALSAYFEFASLYLPVLFEDAFWQDYCADRCSLSLVYAIACRGLPFVRGDPCLSVEEKWAMQWRVAAQFREAFFEAQLQANGSREHVVRLDDLEALALMIHFKYQPKVEERTGGSPVFPPSPSSSATSSLHAHLANLYLTHDSLVLMTMQSGIHGAQRDGNASGDGSGSDSNGDTRFNSPLAPLARLHDRRILLFWHVYGLDAFHCLDKKMLSRIPDSGDDDNIREQLPRHEARGYLDAMLDLSIIARRALTTLSSATARRRGVRADDVLALYDLLQKWRRTDCPPHLRHQRDKHGQLCLSASLDKTADFKHVRLHRAVIWMLEINCYLQIEDCVTENRIRDGNSGGKDGDYGSSLASEFVAMRVEAESVQALRDAVELAQSMLSEDGLLREEEGKPQYAMADLATSILRDCCGGAGNWACARGHEWLQRRLPESMVRQRAGHNRTDEETKRRKHHIRCYVSAIKVLRAAAATAVSHQDTALHVRRMDDQIAELCTELNSTMGI